MKLSAQLMYSGNPRETVDQVVGLEKAGLDGVWVAEAYGFDSPSLMGYLAAKTETVEICSGILNIYSRTPAALLQTVAGLDNVSNGRAVIGLGASGPQVIEGFHGVPYAAPVARMREVIGLIRQGLRGEKLVSEGMFNLPLTKEHGAVAGVGKPLKLINKPERDTVPMVVAALGLKSVASLAEYADGWMPIFFHPEKSAGIWGESLAAGAANRPDTLGKLDIITGGMCAIGEGQDTKDLLDFARPWVALYVGGMGAKTKNFYNDLFVQYGYEKEAQEIQDLYLAGKKDEAAAKIPFEFLDAINLVGPASYVKERIEAYREAGVTNLQITPASADNVALVEQMKELIGD